MNYQYIGKSTPVNNSRAKASGLLRYAGDMKLPNMLHMKLVLSPVAHGIVKAIDSSAALAMPGVAAVLSFENTVDTKYNRGRVRISEDVMDQETLFSRHVRFVGDRVAAVLADSPEIAAAAAEAIQLEIEELPAVFTVKAAKREGAPQLHEDGNTVTLPECGFGGRYADVQGEEFIHRSQTQRVSHIAMETHCAVADYNPGTDRMTVWSPTQSTFGVRSCVAALLGMPMSHVRAIKTPMGGSFGCKQEMILEPLAAVGAKMTGRPVKLQLDRRETILCTVLRHPIKSEIRAKFDKGHILKALDLTAELDAGGYQGVSPDYMGSMFKKLSWVYGVEDVAYHATSTCTNTPMSGSYRGWGGPETAFIMENMMNAAAQKFNEAFAAMLPGSEYYPVRFVGNIAAARREMVNKNYDLVIINAPLPDDFGTRLALNICDNSGTAVLLFVKAEHYPDINGRVSPFGVLVLPKPASSQTVSQSLQLLCGTRERLRRMEQKTASIEEKMEEIRIINRAKLLLMEQLKMTEKEAHRFIEKQAMDRCVTRITIAQSILSTYK